MDDLRTERILRAAECVPAGCVATYGDIGKVAGESPRVVGRTMAQWGSNVPWWRVCNAKGEIPGHGSKAEPYWLDEGTPLHGAGESARVVLKQARMPLAELEAAYQAATADLEPCGE